MRYLSSITSCLSLILSVRASHPVGTYACRASATSGGTLVFANDQQTVHISVIDGECGASADVPYTVTPIHGSDEFWVVPDYSSTNFKAAVSSCRSTVLHADSFKTFRVESRDGVLMSHITVNVGSGSAWEYWLSSRPAPTQPATTQAPTTTVQPTRAIPESHPMGAFGCRGSNRYGGRLDFDEDKQVLRISATVGSCSVSASDVPYTITPIPGSNYEYWVKPDYSSTDFKVRLAACQDPSINADFFDSLHVESNKGVLMSDITISGGVRGSSWNCWLAIGPTRPVPGPTTRSPPVRTTTTYAPPMSHPVGSFYTSMSDGSGGSLIFHQQQQTLSISIRLDICVATAYNVPYHVTPIPGSNGQLWIVPDYSSTNFATKLDSCNDAVVRSAQFRRLRASSEGGSMNGVTASMVGGEDWVFGLAGGPPQPPAYPTRSPATPAHEAHPVGTYESSERSDSVSTIEFYENLFLMSLTIKLGSCTASVRNVPYHIGPLRNHEGHDLDDELFVVPDFSGTDFTTQVDNCRDSDINGGAFAHLFVSSEQGVPMSEISTYGTTDWKFQLRGIPTRPPPTTPTTPLPTTPTPTVPTKPHPSGLYKDDSREGSSVLVFLQKPGNFTMDITLGGCRLYYEDVPYEMVEENGASWVKPDYSSTTLAYALSNCRFDANSRYTLNDLENIEFHDAQDPNDQTLVVYRMLETYGKTLRTVFRNQ